MAAGTKRDVTKALGFVLGALNTTSAEERTDFLNHAVDVLRAIDARTGTIDPSLKRRRPTKKAAKKATKA